MKIIPRYFLAFLIFCLLSIAVPVRAEELTSPDLFPVYGVTLGKTTTGELPEPDGVAENIFEASGSHKIDSVKFGYEGDIFTTLEMFNTEPMPPVWKHAGFEWNLSYQAWIGLADKLGLKIRSIQVPTLQMKDGHSVLEAEFEVFYPGEYPTVFTFTFTENKGTGNDSDNVLYKISAKYVRDFKGFNDNLGQKNQEPVLLAERRRKALALSGIALETKGLNYEKLELAVLNPVNTEHWKKILSEEWGVVKRSQLLEKLASIEAKGDSQLYQEMVDILEKSPELTVNQIGVKFNYNSSQVKRLHFVKEKQGLIGNRSLRAWDYSKIALLCRIGYQAGFLTLNEAWARLDQAVAKVEGIYVSWEDYAANYILGLMFQASESGREIEMGNQALRAYAKLIHKEGSAWQLAWNSSSATGNTLSDVLYFPSIQYQAWQKYVTGWQSYEKGEYNEALDEFQKGFELDNQFKDLWLSLAMVYKAQGNFEKAIEAVNQYLLEEPEAYLPMIYLAEVYENNKQPEEAINIYKKAVDLDGAHPEGFVGLGRMAINSGSFDLAISYLRIAESLYRSEDQGIFYTVYLLGYSYYKVEKFDQALSYFLRAYRGYQGDKYFNYYLGICYLYNQNLALATTYLNRAEELGLTIPQEIRDLLAQSNNS